MVVSVKLETIETQTTGANSIVDCKPEASSGLKWSKNKSHQVSIVFISFFANLTLTYSSFVYLSSSFAGINKPGGGEDRLRFMENPCKFFLRIYLPFMAINAGLVIVVLIRIR